MRAPLVLALLALPALAGCATENSEQPDVLATFYPLGFLAERISNGTVRVDTMVPSGLEPHEWEPSARDVARMGDAKVFLAQGAGLEPWLPGLRETLGARAPPLAYMTAGLPLREAGEDAHAHDEEREHADEAHADEAHADEAAHDATPEGALDPHTWLDPVLFGRQASLAVEAMANAFPEHAPAFRENAQRLRDQLDALHEEYERGLASCDTRTIIANHDAYGYLAARYDFSVVAISGLSPEAEPSPQQLARAIDEAREHNATVIFFEDLVSPTVAEAVAREVGATTRVLSPLEGLTKEGRERGDDYFSVMRANLEGLREAMRCE